ncbi:MAG: hypothetical protein JSV96_05550 [Candidatus Aminicenantes bacterium]|nr:MAG: hypothetical protein JSV96_05550 [Candidatus Aminicenantes bacterium]
MNKIKSFGILCLIILLFTSIGSAKEPFLASIFFNLGFPQGEFGDYVDKVGISGIGHFAYNFPESPFSVGLSLGILMYGRETREEPFSSTIPDVMVDVTATNMIYLGHFFFRVQPREGKLRPYLDALIGLNVLSTDTRVKSQSWLGDSVARSNIHNDATLSYGAGAGLMIQVYSKERKRREGFFSIYIDLGARYLRGAKAEYLTEGSIFIEDGQLIYDLTRSSTDLVTAHMGISFTF